MLTVNKLDVYYGNLQALWDISLTVNEGELVSIIGPNGAGKTTLLLTLSRILKATRGTVEFEGKRIDNIAPHVVVSMGINQVAQGRMLFANMTVQDNLELGALKAKNRDRASIAKKLEEVFEDFPKLRERKNQKAGTLSGGEQQMLAVGRSLMASPKLLLLDEPTTGLSPLVVENLAQVILNLNQRGLAILLVEQNAYMALTLAKRAYVLETGRIVLSGPSSEIINNDTIKHSYLGVE